MTCKIVEIFISFDHSFVVQILIYKLSIAEANLQTIPKWDESF